MDYRERAAGRGQGFLERCRGQRPSCCCRGAGVFSWQEEGMRGQAVQTCERLADSALVAFPERVQSVDRCRAVQQLAATCSNKTGNSCARAPCCCCGWLHLQVVNSATVEKTSDGLQQPETDVSMVDIIPLGCGDDSAAEAAPAAAAPAATEAAAPPAVPATQRPATAPQLTPEAAAAAAADLAPAAAAPAQAAAAASAVAVAAAPAAESTAGIVTPPGELLLLDQSHKQHSPHKAWLLTPTFSSGLQHCVPTLPVVSTFQSDSTSACLWP